MEKTLERSELEKMGEPISDRSCEELWVQGFTAEHQDIKVMMYRDPTFDRHWPREKKEIETFFAGAPHFVEHSSFFFLVSSIIFALFHVSSSLELSVSVIT